MIRNIIKILLCSAVLAISSLPVRAQSFELQQLILNIEKLNQLKSILQQLKDGYVILTKGYNTIKNLSEGNFNIHRTFLDGLLAVSPTVRKYKRIGEIVLMQKQIISQSKSTLSTFVSRQILSPNEIIYLKNVYENLVDRSMKNMDELLMIITSNRLRMNDAERLSAIDRIYDDMSNKLQFLNHFNQKTALLGTQRQREMQENKVLKNLYSK